VKVKELIAELLKFDPEAEVCYSDTDFGGLREESEVEGLAMSEYSNRVKIY